MTRTPEWLWRTSVAAAGLVSAAAAVPAMAIYGLRRWWHERDDGQEQK